MIIFSLDILLFIFSCPGSLKLIAVTIINETKAEKNGATSVGFLSKPLKYQSSPFPLI
jgi:hypothetical protein